MPIISTADRKSLKGRILVALIYFSLIVGGITMVYPFMVMLTGSVSNGYDYERRSVVPRFLASRPDRFMRFLCDCFPPSHRASLRQLRSFFPTFPESWQIWAQIGDERDKSDEWAKSVLALLDDPAKRKTMEAAARDYRDFVKDWDVREAVLAYDNRYVAPFLRERYGSLDALNRAWEISIDDFSKVAAAEWSGEPIDQPGYVPIYDTRYEDLLEFRKQYRENRFTRCLDHENAYAGFLRPAALAFLWEDFVAEERQIKDQVQLSAFPFPVPDTADADLRELWFRFLKEGFPLRHVRIDVTPERQTGFLTFLSDRFRNVEYLNRLMSNDDPDWQLVADWGEVELTETAPIGPMAKVWMDYVLTRVPVERWHLRSTLPEKAFQEFVLARHGSLERVRETYGQELASIEHLRIPYAEAVLLTFDNREFAISWHQITANYRTVFDYLFHRGRAVSNTVILVVLTILITLTVNPLAGYALSRFNLRQTEKIIVFCLATMAFPAAVAAIPGFLLLRDLGLLNTFAALVLPGAANGMTIFLLKGFFDSLPRELYEAATIDGASEWQVFVTISLPLVKPILAVSMLNAFILAYNGWAWAIIVCQDPKMWTIAVWTYQFYQTLGTQPYIVMAAFIVNSFPVLLVFLFCQKIILRGIILPQLK